jgi:hypothetical protein
MDNVMIIKRKTKGVRPMLAKVVGILLLIITKPFIWIRNCVVKFLLRVRSKLHIRSLRQAINDADKDKSETQRKNMVVFNTASGEYEPLQKRLLKTAAKAGKNKSNAAMTKYRKKRTPKGKKRILDPQRINKIEEKSLYVTD